MVNLTNGKSGKFITIEGIEGVGKSTNIRFIRDYLENAKIEHIQTREPGGTKIAECIRGLLLEEHQEAMDATAELLLVFAARAQHLNTVIRPALDRGCWVVCDRFTDATYAYQGGGRLLDSSKIALLESMVQNSLRPDLTLILDLDPVRGLQRASDRGELDRFEKERLDFFQRVRSSYLQIAAGEPARCKVIDASLSIDAVRAATLGAVTALCDQVADPQ